PRLAPALSRRVEAGREALARRADRLSLRPIEAEIARGRQRLSEQGARLDAAFARGVEAQRWRLETADRLRETLGYTATLRRGYAVVRGDGAVLTRKSQAEQARALEIEFADGRLAVGGRTRKPARGDEPPEQGELF
ncbi:exodeoxyribonuclease VII large subunit, partial [Rhodosalinus sp.]|uniref:exodeoxyribonuclease VII large subunit n=1 Tax=Rhodosalinus sp. TaxID=2047741 RepID=UPI00397A9354